MAALLVGLLVAAITQSLGQELCRGSDNYHPHETNCSLFYECLSGFPVLFECPPGLYWNTALDTCDWPINVPECVGGTRPPLTTTIIPTTTTTTRPTTTPTTPPTTTPTIPPTTTPTTPPTTTPTTPPTTTPTTPPTTTPTTPPTTTPTTPPTTTPTTRPTTTPTTRPTTTPTTLPTTTPTTRPTTTTTRPTTTTPAPSRCGGVLTALSGYINYKSSTTYDINERCIWTIAAPGTIGIDFTLEQYSYADPNDGILITGIIYGVDIAPHHVHRLNSQGSSFVSESNAAIVMFYSDSSTVTTGFRMRYIVTTGFISYFPGRHVISSGTPTTTVQHPTTGTYSNGELSTFVYAPDFSYFSSTTVRATYNVRGMDSCCSCDYLSVYKLNIAGTQVPTWTKVARLCSTHNGFTISSNDIILYVFQSDNSGVGSGFTLTFQG